MKSGSAPITAAQKDARNAKSRLAWASKNEEQVAARKQKAREWQQKHPDNFRQAKNKWLASLSKEQRVAYNAKNNDVQKKRRATESEARCVSNKEKAKKWKKQNPESLNRATRKWAAKNQPKIHNWRLIRAYGITRAEYDDLLNQQNGKCAICSSADPGPGRKHFCVDHCHTDDSVRGLLCSSCNLALGKFNDDPNLLRLAASYLDHCCFTIGR